jgi:hypothetical protein
MYVNSVNNGLPDKIVHHSELFVISTQSPERIKAIEQHHTAFKKCEDQHDDLNNSELNCTNSNLLGQSLPTRL